MGEAYPPTAADYAMQFASDNKRNLAQLAKKLEEQTQIIENLKRRITELEKREL